MRLLSLLGDERKSRASWYIFIRQSPKLSPADQGQRTDAILPNIRSITSTRIHLRFTIGIADRMMHESL
jgi:hypothetical protein